MNKNKIVALVVVGVIVVGGVSFFAGTKVAAMGTRGGAFGGQNGQFTGGQRAGGATSGAQNRRMAGAGAVMGEVLSKDASGLTVKLMAGGSKIVLVASSTTISKATAGTLDDVVVGSNVSVFGTANPDGSVTAQNVQIRPAQPMMGR